MVLVNCPRRRCNSDKIGRDPTDAAPGLGCTTTSTPHSAKRALFRRIASLIRRRSRFLLTALPNLRPTETPKRGRRMPFLT